MSEFKLEEYIKNTIYRILSKIDFIKIDIKKDDKTSCYDCNINYLYSDNYEDAEIYELDYYIKVKMDNDYKLHFTNYDDGEWVELNEKNLLSDYNVFLINKMGIVLSSYIEDI